MAKRLSDLGMSPVKNRLEEHISFLSAKNIIVGPGYYHIEANF
jgi:hypothetical protein